MPVGCVQLLAMMSTFLNFPDVGNSATWAFLEQFPPSRKLTQSPSVGVRVVAPANEVGKAALGLPEPCGTMPEKCCRSCLRSKMISVFSWMRRSSCSGSVRPKVWSWNCKLHTCLCNISAHGGQRYCSWISPLQKFDKKPCSCSHLRTAPATSHSPPSRAERDYLTLSVRPFTGHHHFQTAHSFFLERDCKLVWSVAALRLSKRQAPFPHSAGKVRAWLVKVSGDFWRGEADLRPPPFSATIQTHTCH